MYVEFVEVFHCARRFLILQSESNLSRVQCGRAYSIRQDVVHKVFLQQPDSEAVRAKATSMALLNRHRDPVLQLWRLYNGNERAWKGRTVIGCGSV